MFAPAKLVNVEKTNLLDRSAPQAVEGGVQDRSPELLAEEQRKDPEIAPAMEWVSSGQRPPWEEVKSRGPALCALWRQYEFLVLKDNVLCHIFLQDGWNGRFLSDYNASFT